MRLSQLKYALEIMKVKSLSKASENLFITKTALSEAIISLEKELGFEIFMRSRAGMEPTIEGHIFLQGAEKILQIADSWEILKMIKSRKEDIKLAVSYAIFPILNDLMEEFITGKSGVSLEMREYGAGEVLSALSRDKNMIAILSVSETISWPEFKKFEKNNPQWKIEELGNDEFVLAIYKNHPIVKKEVISLEEVNALKREINMVLLSGDKNAMLNKLKCCAGDISLTLTNRAKVMQMVSKGTASSLFPERVVRFEMRTNKQLDYVRVAADDMKIKYFMIYNTKLPITEEKRYILDFMRNCFKQF